MRSLIISAFTIILLIMAKYETYAAFDAFLKISGIGGESTTEGHKDEIGIFGFHYELTAPTEKIGGGVATGKRQHSSIIITKSIDKASPKLMEALCKGNHIEEVVVTFRKTVSTDQEDYFTITLKNAIVSSFSLTQEYTISPASSSTMPLEEVQFIFDEITFADKVSGINYTDKWSKTK